MLVLLCIIFYFSWAKSARICFALNCCLQRWVLFLNILICKISRGQKEDLRKSRKIEHHPSRYACFFFPSTMMIIYYKMMAKIMRNYAMLSKIHSSTKDFNLSFQFKTTFKSAIAAQEPSHVRENHSKLGQKPSFIMKNLEQQFKSKRQQLSMIFEGKRIIMPHHLPIVEVSRPYSFLFIR